MGKAPALEKEGQAAAHSLDAVVAPSRPQDVQVSIVVYIGADRPKASWSYWLSYDRVRRPKDDGIIKDATLVLSGGLHHRRFDDEVRVSVLIVPGGDRGRRGPAKPVVRSDLSRLKQSEARFTPRFAAR
jgi:hypothetical protein